MSFGQIVTFPRFTRLELLIEAITINQRGYAIAMKTTILRIITAAPKIRSAVLLLLILLLFFAISAPPLHQTGTGCFLRYMVGDQKKYKIYHCIEQTDCGTKGELR